MSDGRHLAARHGRRAVAAAITPEQAGWGYAGLRVLDLPPGGSHDVRTGADEVGGAAAGRLLRGGVRRRAVRAGRPGGRLRRRHRLRLPAAGRGRPGDERGRGQVRAPRGPGRRAARAPLRAAVRRPGRAARGRAPARGGSDNFCMPGCVRGRPADRLRGDHPGGQLVLLPAAQARRGAARGDGARGDLLFRDRGRARRPGVAYQRVYGTPDRPADLLAEVRDRRRGADPARLARAVDGRARLRHVLPERDGRARAPTGVAGLRRPGAHLGARHLARPARSTRG